MHSTEQALALDSSHDKALRAVPDLSSQDKHHPELEPDPLTGEQVPRQAEEQEEASL